MSRENEKIEAVYLLNHDSYDVIYGEAERRDIARLAKVNEPVLTAETWRSYPDLCRQVEVILSGWGMPVVDEAFQEAFHRLKTILYGAGSI